MERAPKKAFPSPYVIIVIRGLWSMTAIAFLMLAIHLIGTLTV